MDDSRNRLHHVSGFGKFFFVFYLSACTNSSKIYGEILGLNCVHAFRKFMLSLLCARRKYNLLACLPGLFSVSWAYVCLFRVKSHSIGILDRFCFI